MARKKKIDPSILAEAEMVTGRNSLQIVPYNGAVDKFIEQAELRGLSEHTIKSYVKEFSVLRKYFAECEISMEDVRKLTPEHFEGFVRYQIEKGRANTTINTRMTAYKALFAFCLRKGYVEADATVAMQRMKVRHEVGDTLDKTQVRRLLTSPDTTKFTGLRDYAIMLTFYHTGIRLAELGAIRVQDILLKEHSLYVQRAKNGYARRIPLTKRLQAVLVTYLKVRGIVETSDVLFLTENNTPISARQIQYNLRDYGKKTGVSDEVQVSPHVFRRTFAKNKIQAGVDVFTVQALMGHSDLAMLKRYVDIFSKDLDDAIERGL